MGTRVSSKFTVTDWHEKPYSEMEGGPRLTRATVSKTFQGELAGDGTVEYLMVHRPDGTAAFVGVERVSGKIGKRAGSFVLEHQGSFEGGTAKATCRIVPGSGTGQLAGLRGEGSFEAEGREAPFSIELEFGD